MKLDESRGFDLTINVSHFELARARICWRLDGTACETVKDDDMHEQKVVDMSKA